MELKTRFLPSLHNGDVHCLRLCLSKYTVHPLGRPRLWASIREEERISDWVMMCFMVGACWLLVVVRDGSGENYTNY